MGCALFAVFFGSTNAACAATTCVLRVTNTPSPFFLVGTIHALSGKDYPLPKPYLQALRDSRQFYFERAASYLKWDDIRRHIHPQTCAVIRTGVPTSIVVGTGHFCRPNNVIEPLQTGWQDRATLGAQLSSKICAQFVAGSGLSNPTIGRAGSFGS